MNGFQREAGVWVGFSAVGLAVMPLGGFLLVALRGDRPVGEGRETAVDLALLTGGTLSLLLGGALALFFLCVVESYRGHPPGIESHWGGFGGGLGGWRMSASLVFLLGALILGGLFATLASAFVGSAAAKALLGPPAAQDAPEEPGQGAQEGGEGGGREGAGEEPALEGEAAGTTSST